MQLPCQACRAGFAFQQICLIAEHHAQIAMRHGIVYGRGFKRSDLQRLAISVDRIVEPVCAGFARQQVCLIPKRDAHFDLRGGVVRGGIFAADGLESCAVGRYGAAKHVTGGFSQCALGGIS